MNMWCEDLASREARDDYIRYLAPIKKRILTTLKFMQASGSEKRILWKPVLKRYRTALWGPTAPLPPYTCSPAETAVDSSSGSD